MKDGRERGKMGPRRRLPEPVRRIQIPCFSCGDTMTMIGPAAGWCCKCLVGEYRDNAPSRTRTTRQIVWYDLPIDLIDHSRVHVPSPA